MAVPPQSLLQAAKDTLDTLAAEGGDPPGHAQITAVLERICDLCLVYGADPDDTAALRAFVDATAPMLNMQSMALAAWPGDLIETSKGVWEADEWRLLCQRRSALAFFLDLYRQSDAWSLIQAVEAALPKLDSFVRERGMNEGFLDDHEIDPAIPASHWWWWLPAAVPATR